MRGHAGTDGGRLPAMSTPVNVDSFARAETERMFAGLQRDAGAVNVLSHNREPASVDHQTVIRMNRDTLYGFAVVDISAGATITIPDHEDRYVSVMVVNQDHDINEIFHDPGDHHIGITATRPHTSPWRPVSSSTHAIPTTWRRRPRCRTASPSHPGRRARS